MTIILSISDNENPVCFLSDVLLSARGDLDLPVQLPHTFNPANLRFGEYTLAGLSQKTVILGNTAVMWAGKQVVAKEIIREVFARGNSGMEYFPLSEAIDSLNLFENEKDDVSIMTAFCDRPNNIVTCGHHASEYRVKIRDHIGTIKVAGSGSWDFIENYQAVRQLPVDYSLVVDVIHRMAIRTIEPFVKNNQIFEFLYGGWFELSRHRGQTFEKIPVAFKFWSRRAGAEIYDQNGPLLYSQYIENDLFLSTISQVRDDRRCTVLRIPDVLGRGRAIDTWSAQEICTALNFSPQLFVHVLMDELPENGLNLRVCPFFVDGDPLMAVKQTVQADSTVAASVTVSPELNAFINQEWGPAEVKAEAPRRY